MILKWDVWKHKDNPRGQYTDRKRVMREDNGERNEIEVRPSEEKQAEPRPTVVEVRDTYCY